MVVLFFSGCTTDSGGGGASYSLYNHMDNLDLCMKEEGSYLVVMCCLHTLQLTLSNAMLSVIGKGGLEERTAT